MRKQFKDIDIYAGMKTGRPPSTSRFVLSTRKKTSKVWSTSTSQPVSLPICVVRTV